MRKFSKYNCNGLDNVKIFTNHQVPLFHFDMLGTASHNQQHSLKCVNISSWNKTWSYENDILWWKTLNRIKFSHRAVQHTAAPNIQFFISVWFKIHFTCKTKWKLCTSVQCNNLKMFSHKITSYLALKFFVKQYKICTEIS